MSLSRVSDVVDCKRSRDARDEINAMNNHGVWCDVQIFAISLFLTDDGSHPAAAAVAARARVRVDIQTAFRSREMKPCPRRWLARNPSATPSFASAYCSTSPRCSSTWHHSPGWWSSTSPRIQYSDPDQDLQDLQVLLLRSGTKYVSPGGKRRPWPGVQKRAPRV